MLWKVMMELLDTVWMLTVRSATMMMWTMMDSLSKSRWKKEMNNSSLRTNETVIMVRLLVLFVLSLSYITGESQQIISLHSGGSASLRGLCAVNEKVIWVSGSSGTVGLSTDGGKNWKWIH